ncbi:MAG: ferredoxin family protein [Lentisphaeria bacterium]|jgi:NAD-dependent dihydropyrimidine dehydrogenase PreA subunit
MSDQSPNHPAPAKPYPVIHADECKACGRCIAACPKKVLRWKDGLNRRGCKAVEYVGDGCIGCALCFYTCPEPYTLEIHKPDKG